jgi:mercuric ion transport protein
MTMSRMLSQRSALNPGGALSFLSLFTSLGTLLCCALPSLLVLFGLGATVATVLSDMPWLVTLSHHKQWVFVVAGVLITGNFVYVYGIAPRLQRDGAGCDPNNAADCQTLSRFSRIVLWCSAGLYLAGVFAAFILGPLLVRFDS